MDSLPFNLLDALILLVIVVSGLFAYRRGLIHEVLSIFGWVGAVAVAIYGIPSLRPIVGEFVSNGLVTNIVSAAILFILSLVILSLITRWLASKIRDSALNAVDRSLGFLFGLLRGAVIVCLLYAATIWIFPKDDHPRWIAEARLLPYVDQLTEILENLVPDDLLGKGRDSARETRRKAEELLDAEQQLRKFIEPKPTPPTQNDADAEGYTDEQRKALDRLIQTDQ